MDKLVDTLRGAFGYDIVFRLNHPERVPNVEFKSTGIATLDNALGGGLPVGRIIEIYGPESSGKTATACAAIGSLQHQDYTAVYIDMEYAFNPVEAESNGVNIDDLFFSQPEDARTAMKMIEMMVRNSETPLVIVLDSVAALVTPAELEADPGDARIGETARLMSQMMRKLKGPVSTGNHILIFTNQLRMKIGQMFGNPETTTGGRALRFYASQRIQTLSRKKLGPKGEELGIRVRIQIDKNKVAQPFRTAEFDILWDGTGVDKIASTLDVAVLKGVVRKGGGYHYYPSDSDKYLASSRDAMVVVLKEDKELYDRIFNDVLEIVRA
jgi:recombination protein RecA